LGYPRVFRGANFGALLLLLAACHQGKEPADDRQELPHVIFGKYYLTEDLNDFEKLEQYYHFGVKDRDVWPDIYGDTDNQVIFHFTQWSGHDGYNSNDNIHVCRVVRAEFKHSVDVQFRDFDLICKGGQNDNSDAYTFGSSLFKYEKGRYRFRLFGDGFRRLRYTDEDGVDLYFRRVS
jgi:hypothetical protein